MVRKIIVTIMSSFLLFSCSTRWKTLSFHYFTIEVPKDWKYVKRQGYDSFVGELKGREIVLSFDCSDMGYAGVLVKTPEEYLTSLVERDYKKIFNKPGVKYVNEMWVDTVKLIEMKKLNTSDTTQVKVEPIIYPTIKRISSGNFAGEGYLVEVAHRDSIIVIEVNLPEDVKNRILMHNIEVDTIDNYLVKTFWPKKAGNGHTGVYYKKLNGRFNMNLQSVNLSEQHQNQVLNVFKTIKMMN